MARREALLRLRSTLTARRAELRKRFGMEMDDLARFGSGDSADQALESTGEEVSSQLAEIEGRELVQIERALKKLLDGSYGSCEVCSRKIPVGRLDALPYSTVCVSCQRDIENDSEGYAGGYAADWERVNDHNPYEDRKVRVSDLEYDFAR